MKIVDRAQPSDQQYSLQHVKHFAIHNHIFSDPYNPFAVYIVDKAWTILRVSIDLVDDLIRYLKCGGFQSFQQKVGRFNITVSFPDDKHAVLSDGCQTLYIVKTGDRKSSETWNPLFTYNPFDGKASPEFSVLDSIIYKVGDNSLLTYWQLGLKIRRNGLRFYKIFRLYHNNHSLPEGTEEIKWTFKNQKTLLGHTGVEYAHLEPSGTGIYVASDSKFYMVIDTEKAIDVQAHYAKSKRSEDKGKPEYLWTQTMEEVKIWFRVPSTITKRDVDIEIKKESIIVTHKGRYSECSHLLLIKGVCHLMLPLIPQKYTVQQKMLQIQSGTKFWKIVLEKKEKDVVWVDEVVKGNSCGGQLSDPELGADPGQSDAYDPRELEECDEYPADSSCLIRIDRTLQRISHVSRQSSMVIQVRLQPNIPPAICVRHDVDGIIWKPQLLSRPQPESILSIENVKWECEHVNTFSALGYVQASKQQRKYTLCSSDVSYVAICDVKKHIYVYCQPSKIETCLRNRRTGQQVTHVAKQLVISLDPPEDILGAYATPLYLYVLTPENFHAIKILAERRINA
ncbi:NudC domain-containing protein 1 [Orchesella cincta]|uniref:NudC domain-containing protein 1 n=1 Tax=Orchesella cincta TaxID=48709 RepID=A0A1D2M4J5_ORCCI|nr:NudC domain-containing protein 1 [Orchesella cincta]